MLDGALGGGGSTPGCKTTDGYGPVLSFSSAIAALASFDGIAFVAVCAAAAPADKPKAAIVATTSMRIIRLSLGESRFRAGERLRRRPDGVYRFKSVFEL
jgi:hypothetical protein